MKYDVNNIRPFNKCFFYNCTHSCLFSIIESNCGDYREFMVNSIPFLEVRKDNSEWWFLVRIEFIRNHKDILKDQGITLHIIDEPGVGWTDIVCQELYKNNPVIVSVDCYELDYREDFYKKGYWPHSILIYNYDSNNNTFKVIDQPDRDTTMFKQYEIKKDQLEKAIRLYQQMRCSHTTYNSDMAISFACVGNYSKRTNVELNHDWMFNRIAVDGRIINGINDVEVIIPRLIDSLHCVEHNDTVGYSILNGLNDVVKQKKWEKDFVLEIASNIKICDLMVEIYNNWEQVRKCVGLIVFSRKIRKKSMIYFEEKLRTVLKMEKQLQCLIKTETSYEKSIIN